MKHDLNWYMNEARRLNDIKSDRKLAIALEVSGVGLWRHPERHVVPEQSVMVKLSKLAGVTEEIGLIDRDIWVAGFKAPETVPFYESIKEKLKNLQNAAAVILLACGITFGSSDIDGGSSAPSSSASSTVEYILW